MKALLLASVSMLVGCIDFRSGLACGSDADCAGYVCQAQQCVAPASPSSTSGNKISDGNASEPDGSFRISARRSLSLESGTSFKGSARDGDREYLLLSKSAGGGVNRWHFVSRPVASDTFTSQCSVLNDGSLYGGLLVGSGIFTISACQDGPCNQGNWAVQKLISFRQSDCGNIGTAGTGFRFEAVTGSIPLCSDGTYVYALWNDGSSVTHQRHRDDAVELYGVMHDAPSNEADQVRDAL